LCRPTLSPLGHVSPLSHLPIGLLRFHEFNTSSGRPRQQSTKWNSTPCGTMRRRRRKAS